MNETFVTKKIAPKKKFSEFCIISRKTLGILAMYVTTIGECTEDLVAKLDEDYENARLEDKVTITDTKLTFPSRYKKPDGTTVEIVLKPNAYEGDKEWFFYYVVTDVNDTQWTKESAPSKQLESFAYLGSWETLLADLAAKAIPEEWDFVGSNTASREKIILVQYLRHTFSRLLYEKKICIDRDEQFAAFNTGLVDRYYDDIYACFVPNIAGYENKWRFAGFCTAGVNSLGKQLVNTFNPLPAPAVYFKCKEDLLFDQTKPLHVDFKHILLTMFTDFHYNFCMNSFMTLLTRENLLIIFVLQLIKMNYIYSFEICSITTINCSCEFKTGLKTLLSYPRREQGGTIKRLCLCTTREQIQCRLCFRLR